MKRIKWMITILGFIFFITFAIAFVNCGDSGSKNENGESSTENFTLTVDKNNIHVIDHSYHASASLPAGNYTISWKSGGICGGASCSSPDDYSPIFAFVSEDSSKQFFYLLQDPGDSIQVTQSRKDEIYAWYMDINTFDNKGQATLSISGQPDLIVDKFNCEVFNPSDFAEHSLSEGHYKIQWKEGGITCGSNPNEYVPLVIFISEDPLKNFFYLLPNCLSSVEIDQNPNPNGRILAWYMDINSFDNEGEAIIAILKW